VIEPLLSDDAFLADVELAQSNPPSLHLWWLGQSGYLMKWADTRLLIDPYLSDSLTRKYASSEKPHVRMTRRVIDPARLRRINIITSSHQHTDHLDAETLQAIRKAGEPEWMAIFVAPRAIKKLAEERWGGDVDVLLNDGESHGWNDVSIHAIPAAHDRLERNERGWSIYLGYVFHIGPHVLYHSGDTVLFEQMAELLEPFKIDLAILPINGKVGNMSGADAARLAKAIGAKIVVPCHYEMFEFNTADPREQFIPECERIGQAYRILRAGERLTLS
jgi:L-ascorbate metabolism protein UlaG (beta-lactamase superfamily)